MSPISMSQFKNLTVETSFREEEVDKVYTSPSFKTVTDMMKFLHVDESGYKEFGRQALVMRLCYAAALDNVDLVAEILTQRVDPDSYDYEKKAPLHIAASNGSIKVVSSLLAAKAKVDITDAHGNTPLWYAQKGGNGMGHARVAQLLLDAGAKAMRVEKLASKATMESWAINRSKVELKKELCSTFKSTVHLASWLGTDVVVKFPKVEEQQMLQHFSSTKDIPLSPAALKKRRHRPGDDVTTESLNDIEVELVHEVELLVSLRHPDLVMFLGACFEERPIMFVLEYMPQGDLEQYYMKKRDQTNGIYYAGTQQVIKWASAVARALAFLHSMKRPIVHRDLKPLNLLLTQTLEVKVTDFGISKMATASSFQDSYKMTGGVGTWIYMAPEVVRGQHYTEKVDIYSFALIMYFMASGRAPFWHLPSKEPDACLKEYLAGREPRPQVSDCPISLRPIMQAAWSVDPEQRPCATDLTQDLAGLDVQTKCCTIA